MLMIQTFEKNWAKVAQIVLIVLYTFFISFDVVVIIIAATSGEDKNESEFVMTANTMLEWI